MSSPARAKAARQLGGPGYATRGLCLPKPNNTNVNYGQFAIVAADNKNLTTGQINANRITKQGKYNTIFCMSCLCSPEFFEFKKAPGRGNSAFNELVACKVSELLGCGGTQCDRCVGLGQGGSCAAPPAAAYHLARNIIKLAPQYNDALIRIGAGSQTCDAMTNAEKEVCRKMSAAAKDLRSFVQGLQKSGKVESTPNKKRTRLAMEAASEQSDTAEAIADFRRDIKAQDVKIDALTSQMKILIENSEYQSVMLVAARARERRLMEGIESLLGEANRIRDRANLTRDDNEQYPELESIMDVWREDDLAEEDLENEALNAPPL